jgi:hypothetical protein
MGRELRQHAHERARDRLPRHIGRGAHDAFQRLLGQIRSELEYRPISEIIEELPHHMDEVQLATSAASEAIRQRYFPTNAAPTWVGELT